MKLHIIGMAGSGKTTLARWAAAEFGIPAHDLDYVVYGDAGERPEAEIVARLEEIRAGRGWVTEGAYRNAWLHPLLADSDSIVWLDVPLRTCLYRIVRRHVIAEMSRTNPHPGWRRLVWFLNYTRRIAHCADIESRELLAPHRDKVTRCQSSADMRAVRTELKRLASPRLGTG
ncbi:MAG: hypothetical protein WEC75_12995 [Dehalococcoidia bacterium]